MNQSINASVSPKTLEEQCRRAQVFARNCSAPDLLGVAFRLDHYLSSTESYQTFENQMCGTFLNCSAYVSPIRNRSHLRTRWTKPASQLPTVETLNFAKV